MWPFKRKPLIATEDLKLIDTLWDTYREWAAAQVCQGCGRKISDREEGEFWVHEDLCMTCWKAGFKYFDSRPQFGGLRK